MSQSAASVVRLFRRLLGSSAAAATGDGLVEAFVRRRDERAFEELVRRHGPMVLGVCRRVLRDSHAADDAFQVTFLTLACKASSLRRGQALAAWLHRVALHVALRARSRGRRAGEVEREATPMLRPEPSAEVAWRELPAVLDEELLRLPETLRGPLVLCGLEGKTHEEAARELGWPIGSLSKRLARGRELLRQRLARRGFEIGSTALGTGLIGEATAAVPEPLLSTTVRSAVAVAAGHTAGLSAATAALLQEVLNAMFWTRVKVGMLVLLAATLIAPLVGLALFAPSRADRPAPRDDQAAPPARADRLVAALGPKTFRFRSVMLSVAYSPDGKLLAVGEYNTIHLFDAVTKKALRTWDGPEGIGIRSLAFSPDSKVLATADQSPRLRLYTVATGKLRDEFDGHTSGAQFITFSPDGKMLATAGEDRGGDGDKGIGDLVWRISDHSVRIRDAITGREIAAFANGLTGGKCVAFSPDSQLVAWGGYENKVHVRKVTGGKDVFTFTQEGTLREHIHCVDFSLDSKVLAVGNGKVIKLFDVATNKELKTLQHQPPLRGQVALLDGFRVRFSPDGQTLGSVCQGGVALWDVASGKLHRVLGGYVQAPTDLTFHRDGKKLATAAAEQSVRFWDLLTGLEEVEQGHQGSVDAVALSPDGKLVVTARYLESVRFWDRSTGKELRRMVLMPVHGMAFVPDGLLIAGSGEDHLIRLYDPATGREKGTVGKDLRVGMCMTVSADGKLLAVGQEGIRIVELPSGKEKVKLAGHGSYCASVAFGPDSKTLVSGGQETVMPQQTYAVKLWDLATGKELRRLEHPAEHAVNSVACSPDGQYVLTDRHTYNFGPPPVADMATAKVVVGPGVGWSPFGRRPMVFSPDGKLLAVATESSHPKPQVGIELWDTANWEKVAVLEGDTQRIIALAFSADGKFLVSGSEDTSARVWDASKRNK